MASTVPRARVANWPHGQVQKGISKPTHQSNIEALYFCGREPSAASPCADGRPRHAQAAIRGIETSLVAPLTLGRIRWCVTRENPSLRQAAVVIPILGLYSA